MSPGQLLSWESYRSSPQSCTHQKYGLSTASLGYKMAVKMCTYQPLCSVGLRFEGYVRSHFNVGVSLEWYLILSFRTSWCRSLGKMLQFDNHIFSNGWLNHQLENFWGGRNAGIPMIAFQWSLFKASPNCKFQTFVTPQTSVGKTYPTLDFVYFCVVADKHRRTYLSLDLMIPESTHLTK